MSERDRILGKVQQLQAQGAAAAGAMGRGFAGITSYAAKFSENLAKIPRESWREGAQMMESIKNIDWSGATQTLGAFTNFLKQLGIVGEILSPFLTLMQILDSEIIRAFAEEIKGLNNVLLSEENRNKLRDLANGLHDVWEWFDKLEKKARYWEDKDPSDPRNPWYSGPATGGDWGGLENWGGWWEGPLINPGAWGMRVSNSGNSGVSRILDRIRF